MPWKTTCHKEQRWKFIRQYLRRTTGLAQLCRQWSISRKTAYKWIQRFGQRGRFGLADRRRCAHRIHNRPAQLWLARLRRWRAHHPTWGAPKLRWALRRRFGSKDVPSESAISRWLKEWKLTRRRRRRAHKGPILARPRLSAARRPNDVWTVDFKGWFVRADGTRVEPLIVRDLASRYVLEIALLRRQTVRESQEALEKVFREYGLPRVIRCDNGAPFGASGALGLTRLSAWWVKLGIQVEFIAPGHPEQNGAHEQLNRVYKEEVAHPAAASFRAQKKRTGRWRWEYNHHRPHEGLRMRVPAEIYRKSRRRMPGRLEPWRYARGWESRRVKSQGMITFHGRSRFIGEAFECERVGLKRVRAGVWEVYYGSQLIGELWESETGAIRAARYAKGRPPK